MTSYRLLLSLVVSVVVVLGSPAQSKRDTGPVRTEKKESSKAASRDDGRKTPRNRYEPLPHPAPQTQPVDVNYPPIIIQSAYYPPPPPYLNEPEPVYGNPRQSRRVRERRAELVELGDCMDSSDQAGYCFASKQVVSCEDSTVDLYLSTTGPDSAYFLVPQDNDIKDLGPFESIWHVVRFKPHDWSEDHGALLTAGHVYVVWTSEGDFILARVTDLGERHVAFEWVRHSNLSRTVAAEAERRQKEKDAEKAKRQEELGPYFTK